MSHHPHNDEVVEIVLIEIVELEEHSKHHGTEAATKKAKQSTPIESSAKAKTKLTAQKATSSRKKVAA